MHVCARTCLRCSVRNVLPSVPAQSVGIDYFGFIFFMIMLMLAGASILAHMHRWYVAPAPTLYNRARACMQPAVHEHHAPAAMPAAAKEATAGEVSAAAGPAQPRAVAAGAATAAAAGPPASLSVMG